MHKLFPELVDDLHSRVDVLAAPQIADQLGATSSIPDHSAGTWCYWRYSVLWAEAMFSGSTGHFFAELGPIPALTRAMIFSISSLGTPSLSLVQVSTTQPLPIDVVPITKKDPLDKLTTSYLAYPSIRHKWTSGSFPRYMGSKGDSDLITWILSSTVLSQSNLDIARQAAEVTRLQTAIGTRAESLYPWLPSIRLQHRKTSHYQFSYPNPRRVKKKNQLFLFPLFC